LVVENDWLVELNQCASLLNLCNEKSYRWHSSCFTSREETIMKSKVLALFLFMATPVLAGGFFFGFGGGPRYHGGGYGGGYGYYPRPPIVTYAPAPVYSYPPSYYGDSGYYAPSYGPGYGYSAYGAPPFAGAIWFAPRYYGGRYYRGYWGRRR